MTLFTHFSSHDNADNALAHMASTGKQYAQWSSLHGSSYALAVVEAANQCDHPCVIIANSSTEALGLIAALEFFKPEGLPLHYFPDWETLPYDHFSPHEDIISERLRTLNTISTAQQGIILISINAMMLKLCPPDFLAGNAFILEVGQTLDLDNFRHTQVNSGYQMVSTVYEHGHCAIRGNIIDIFPMGSKHPIRIELFDDEISSLRTFDPETQRTLKKIERIDLLPAREYPLDKNSRIHFAQRWQDTFAHDPKNVSLFQDIKQGIATPGCEYYLPLFFDELGTFFDYLPQNSHLFYSDESYTHARQFWGNMHDRYEELRHDIQRPIMSPESICSSPEVFFQQLKAFTRTKNLANNTKKTTDVFDFNTHTLPPLSIDHKHDTPLHVLADFIQANNPSLLFCADSLGRRELLSGLLVKIGVKPVLVDNWADFIQLNHNSDSPVHALTIAPIEHSFWLTPSANNCTPHNFALIGESALFGTQVLQRRRRDKQQQVSADLIIKNLAELKVGEAVVHEHSGVGRYLGLTTLDAAGQQQEFLILEYAEDAKLYVPVYALHLISRYGTHADDTAPLHRLGSDSWNKQRKKAQKQIFDTAAELLETYAKREASTGQQFTLHEADHLKFCADFPFEETPDQATAIDAVLTDMQSVKPMDRLICGDVGFGKTEVAMRASFMAVSNDKQVVILAPTTLLAKQHYENFTDRFADWPIKIEQLSRFNSPKEQAQTIKNLASGQTDIVIGTHKLIQKDIAYKRIGLVIIDEEHRFGVRQKEQLKRMKADADILTMTATPIPRTLNMALGGLRDLSIITTPPAKRLAVKTFVAEHQPSLIKEAIYREILRGGQVYFLHNKVQTIEKAAQDIAALVPEARVGIAHGQLRERELEEVMRNFYHRRFNVLVCSTIIETGIDIPNANTILINRADNFGLAQLHQLRGRVGRSHHQAYAYLLTPHPRNMTKDAIKRLEAIEAANTLGAGFMLASQDLEIRGAGQLLGDDQSGNINHIGFSLYMDLLDRAVQALKQGNELTLDDSLNTGLEVNLQVSALIPESYVGDVHHRLVLYKRIANAKNTDTLHDLQIEMIDRFGLLPQEVKDLIQITEVKLLAQPLKLTRIDMHGTGGSIRFANKPNIDPLQLVQLVQKDPHIYTLSGTEQLKFRFPFLSLEDKIFFISALIKTLMPQP